MKKKTKTMIYAVITEREQEKEYAAYVERYNKCFFHTIRQIKMFVDAGLSVSECAKMIQTTMELYRIEEFTDTDAEQITDNMMLYYNRV